MEVTSLSAVNQCCSAIPSENRPICTSRCPSGCVGKTGLVLLYSTVLSSVDSVVCGSLGGVPGGVRPEEGDDEPCPVQGWWQCLLWGTSPSLRKVHC